MPSVAPARDDHWSSVLAGAGRSHRHGEAVVIAASTSAPPSRPVRASAAGGQTLTQTRKHERAARWCQERQGVDT